VLGWPVEPRIERASQTHLTRYDEFPLLGLNPSEVSAASNDRNQSQRDLSASCSTHHQTRVDSGAMTNIASVLKSEISRIARREVRSEIDSLKKASAHYRAAIAQLRREVADLHKQLKRAGSAAAAEARVATNGDTDTPRRFSSTRLVSHRKKLGLSAAAYGKLVGMSGATIYLWEQGKSRPNDEQLQRLAAVRTLGKRAAHEKAER